MPATDAQKQMAFAAALYATHPRARLIHLRPSGALLLVSVAMPDGSIKLIRTATADQPELDALPENERSRVRSAFLALAQTEGARNG